MSPKPFAALAALALAAVSPALAQAPLEGSIIATRACPATQSIRGSDTRPLTLEVDRAYRLFGENRTGGTHYLIAVPGAEPERRWIEKGCGQRVVPVGDVPVVGASPGETAARPASQPSGAGGERYVLAISWQPAFCETRPGKAECISQTAERFDAANFTLHGLWPQPRGRDYCGVSDEVRALDQPETWNRLPEPEISAATREVLQRVMPGTQSALDRHEWIKHGTCYGADAEEYFADSIVLLDAINASAVRTLFAENVGGALTLEVIRSRFDQAFGKGAGDRVRVSCPRDGERRVISELTIGLAGEISPQSEVATLILAAPPTENGGCNEGEVDAVGLQ